MSAGRSSQSEHAELVRVADEGDAEIGAQRVERAAGQIDDLLHAEHELQPGGDQEQHGGVKHAAGKDVGKRRHSNPVCRIRR